jgi:hypothetical protein
LRQAWQKIKKGIFRDYSPQVLRFVTEFLSRFFAFEEEILIEFMNTTS